MLSSLMQSLSAVVLLQQDKGLRPGHRDVSRTKAGHHFRVSVIQNWNQSHTWVVSFSIKQNHITVSTTAIKTAQISVILHHFVSQLRVCAPSVSWPPANQPNWLSSQTFLPTNQCPLFSLIINQAFPPFASDYKRKKLIFWFKKMHRYTNGSSPIHNFLFSKQLHPRVGNCYVITMLHYRSLWVETKQNSWVVTESNLRIRW